jgi:hypothetical protein
MCAQAKSRCRSTGAVRTPHASPLVVVFQRHSSKPQVIHRLSYPRHQSINHYLQFEIQQLGIVR